jgi:hypothetical protein
MAEASHELPLPWSDPIVAEVRAAREALLAEANYDLHSLCEFLRRREALKVRATVSRSPRTPMTAEVRSA